jgi:nucleoside recognition membrane protein YjiH
MIPFNFGDEFTIPIAYLANQLNSVLAQHITLIVTSIIVFMAVVSLLATVFKPSFLKAGSFFKHLLVVSPLWLITRLLGAVFVLMTYYKTEAFSFGDQTIDIS